MNLNDVTIRPIQLNELPDAAALRSAGFGGSAEQILEQMQSSPRYNALHVLGAENAGELVGTATVFPAQMWLSGVPMDVGAVAGVTVLPDYRNHSIAAKMMAHAITEMHAAGRALSVLFPFSHKYYRDLGYGTISDLHAYSFTPDNLAVSGKLANVRPFEPGDLAMMRSVYKGQMTWHNGWFTRSNDWWAKIIERWPNIIVYENDGFIEGYLMYQIAPQANGQRVLEIKEFFSAEPAAYQGLLAWLAAQTDIARIEYMAPADTPLRHSLRQPYAAGGQHRGWIFNDLCHVIPGPMGRIINLPKAFTTRFYTRGVSGELTFKVIDPLIPANEAPIVFRLVDGRAETRPATDSEAKNAIETDITTLTQILCGYMKTAEARTLGRFTADADTCSWLDKIIVDAPLFIPAGDWF